MACVLVVSPHGMDEALGCGGTMARHARAGDRVEILVLFGDGSGMDAGRRIAAPQAAAALGSGSPRFAGFPENRSDTIPLIELIKAVERAVKELCPDVVYVTHGGNLNIDHQNAYKAVLTAIRPLPGQTVKEILAYEILSSTEWASRDQGQPFLPTCFVDITDTLAAKLEALRAYGAEMREAPHSRSYEGVQALAVSRGHGVGVGAAEAFSVVRMMR